MEIDYIYALKCLIFYYFFFALQSSSTNAESSYSIVGDLLDYLNESWTHFHATGIAFAFFFFLSPIGVIKLKCNIACGIGIQILEVNLLPTSFS